MIWQFSKIAGEMQWTLVMQLLKLSIMQDIKSRCLFDRSNILKDMNMDHLKTNMTAL